MRILLRLFLLAIGAATALGLYAFWYEPSSLHLSEYDVALGPDQGFVEEPLRIAVIADLHAGAPFIDEAKIDRVVAITNQAKPDIALLAGDYVIQGVLGGKHIPIETTVRKLRGLSAPLGVFAVIGNHDRWEDEFHIRGVLESAGIRVLENASTEIVHGGGRFYLVGFGDAFTTTPDVTAALANIPREARALCFTHSPDVFPSLPETCALTIAGHTHGGQVWLPFLGRRIVPSRYGERYAAGLVHEDGKILFVSTGIGTSIIPVRFAVPPEISILNVR